MSLHLLHSICQVKYQTNIKAYNQHWKISTGRLQDDICHHVWSPIIFKGSHEFDDNYEPTRGGYRCAENFHSSYWCALDFDDDLTLRQAVENVFCDYVHVIATTRSHQKQKNGVTVDRFRVCLPWTTPITKREDYEYNMRIVIDRVGADPQAKDGARLFYPCVQIISTADEGETMDWETPPKIKVYEPLPINKLKVIPGFIAGFLKYGAPENERNTTCFRIACGLYATGYNEDDIFALIIKSPIPIDGSEKVRNEVCLAIKSAIKTVRSVASNDRKEETKGNPSHVDGEF